jgi:Ca2+-binding EF-hand superfamily protein
MEDLSFHIRSPVVYGIMDTLDTKENEFGVTFDMLVDEIMKNVEDDLSKEGLKRIFDLYKDSSNVITIGGLKNITSELKEQDLNDELERLNLIARTNGNYVTFEDFYSAFGPKEEETEL